MSLARRTVSSIQWRSITSILRVAILFVRSVLLARLLPVEVFGVYAGARVFVTITSDFSRFGLGGAFMHRAKESDDEEETAANFLTLLLIFSTIWVVFLILFGFVFLDGDKRTTLIALALAAGLIRPTEVPRKILQRRVIHRRLAMVDLVTDIATTVIAVGLALAGAELWALISTEIVVTAVAILLLYVWRPVWRPRLAWNKPILNYLTGFGSKNLGANVLQRMLDRSDDLWISVFLSADSMGLYSRAYAFASYPRKILARPINSVALGTYAELKEKRHELSQSFFRINALLIRSGFLMGGLLSLIAPEFIRIVIGAKWLPFLDAYRLMLAFTLLDPLKFTIGHLMIAVGEPAKLARIRLIQFVVLFIGLFALGWRWGIVGIAVAVNLMLVVGICLLFFAARHYIDFSLVKLFLFPTLALGAALISARMAIQIPGVLGSDYRTGAVKIVVFTFVYGVILVVTERKQMMILLRRFRRGSPSPEEV